MALEANLSACLLWRNGIAQSGIQRIMSRDSEAASNVTLGDLDNLMRSLAPRWPLEWPEPRR